MKTCSSRLPLGRQKLKLLSVTELDEDIDCPLVVVVVLGNLNLARTTDASECGREFFTDAVHEASESGLPKFLQGQVSGPSS